MWQYHLTKLTQEILSQERMGMYRWSWRCFWKYWWALIHFLSILFFINPSGSMHFKIKLIFIFTLLCGVSKGFKKAFIRPFKVLQRSVKMKIWVDFFSLSRIGTVRVKYAEYCKALKKVNIVTKWVRRWKIIFLHQSYCF